MTGFSDKVMEATRSITRGRVATYADLARALGNPKAARAVGTALKNNKKPITIPCHRVIKSDGSLGQYSGKGSKEKLLAAEGVVIINGKVDLERFRAGL